MDPAPSSPSASTSWQPEAQRSHSSDALTRAATNQPWLLPWQPWSKPSRPRHQTSVDDIIRVHLDLEVLDLRLNLGTTSLALGTHSDRLQNSKCKI